MKSKFSILCICILFLTSCKGNDSKNSNSSSPNFSNKNTAAQIINYYNLVIDYNANASEKISKLIDKDLKTLDKMVTAKSKNKGFITWTTFIGIDPRSRKMVWK